MDEQNLKDILWQQFGASIDMLENAIEMCPLEVWENEKQFWYNAYHCLFWLDFYLTLDTKSFHPPKPFTLSEFNPDGEMPERVYTKKELLSYKDYCQQKCRNLIESLNNETINTVWTNASKTRSFPIVEILIYNMRHVQHHVAQLNLILRQEINNSPDWVSRAKIKS